MDHHDHPVRRLPEAVVDLCGDCTADFLEQSSAHVGMISGCKQLVFLRRTILGKGYVLRPIKLPGLTMFNAKYTCIAQCNGSTGDIICLHFMQFRGVMRHYPMWPVRSEQLSNKLTVAFGGANSDIREVQMTATGSSCTTLTPTFC
jgi:hypothetical protein